MLVSERAGTARRTTCSCAPAPSRRWRSCCCSAARCCCRPAARTRPGSTRWRRRSPTYERTASGLQLDPVADADLPRLLPLLDQARALPHGYDHSARRWCVAVLRPVAGRQAGAGARSVYRHALERVLLPRLIWRLEAQMRGNLSRPDFLYEATRVYLMLGSAGPLDRDLVRTWMAADWQATYPGAILAPTARQPVAPPRCRCWRSRCRRSRSTARWSRRRAPRSAASRWPAASIRASLRRRRRRRCRRGGRPTLSAPPARAFSSAPPASR